MCNELNPRYLWDDADGSPWFRCLWCGSDSSTTEYAEIVHRYDAAYLGWNLGECGSREALAETMKTNLEWFDAYDVPAKTFLDIGCLEGCAIEAMRSRGWDSWGFDVNPAAAGEHVVIGPRFDAQALPSGFGAVMVREVIEHVADWRDLLRQCAEVLTCGGLLQVQTPRPCGKPDPLPYQWAHLQVFSPLALRTEIERAGFDVLEGIVWDRGQKWMARKR